MFKTELNLSDTRCFIFDTGSKLHSDIDYKYYSWNKHRYNRVRSGDLFVYRFPQKISPSKQFFFFGCGKIQDIHPAQSGDPQFSTKGDQYATFEKALPFENLIFQSDISPKNFEDQRSKPDHTWQYFFNQYGMKEITKDEFSFLIQRGTASQDLDDETTNAYITAHNKIRNGDYSCPDMTSTSKSRGAYQKQFSDTVKTNYKNTCAITGVTTRSLLIGAHIKPWAEDKSKRLDPQNGICLSRLVDACYEQDLLGIDLNCTVKIAERVKQDRNLFHTLKNFHNKKILLPIKKENFPAKDSLLSKYNKFTKNNVD